MGNNSRINSRTVRLSVTILVMIVNTLASAGRVVAQGSRADYNRAERFDERTRDRVYRAKVNAHWLKNPRHFWYRLQVGPDEFEFVLVDTEQGSRAEAFDHERLAEALSEATERQVAAMQLPFRAIEFSDDLTRLRFSTFGKRWQCELDTYTLTTTDESTHGGNAHSGVRVLSHLERSSQGGEETSIRFVNRTANPVELYWMDPSGRRVAYGKIESGEHRDQHTFAGHVWLVLADMDRPLAAFVATSADGTAIIDGTQTLTDARLPRRGRRARRSGSLSPDGKWMATIRDHNVVLLSQSQNADRPAQAPQNNTNDHSETSHPESELRVLSTTGTTEEPFEPRFYWSPDSTHLVAMQVRRGEARQIHLIESAPDDQLQPKLHSLDYAKPGDRMPVARPRLFDITTGQQIDVADDLFLNAWSITHARWSADSEHFTFLYNQRGHQVLRLIEIAARTGATRAIIEETSSTFIDYAHKQYLHGIEDTSEIIWMSERNGWNHLYLYDARTGTVKNAITHGEWVVRGVERVDEEQRQIWFRAGGIHAQQDPYHVHLARVDFDGTHLTLLTDGDGTHEWEFSPDGRFLIASWSRVDHPPVTELRRTTDGTLVCELERADWSALLAAGWRPPERFVAAGRDGQTDIYGVLVRPTHFEPDCTYPVIEKIYAGPQGAFVPKSFGRQSSLFALSELGFIVVQIDGMGTSYRSKAFHDVCHKNLVDAGLPDRIAWLRAAAAKHPELDLQRVGIYGGSAGGQNALAALLTHGDFYKVGVADCGCHDNRMDKIWWNELWMGWPIGPHYAAQSNATLAHRLQGKLLLTVGELDRNVDPASTMQVVDALIKADKDFELLIMPGVGHGAGERPYARRRRADFFVRHLLGVEPRWDAAE